MAAEIDVPLSFMEQTSKYIKDGSNPEAFQDLSKLN